MVLSVTYTRTILSVHQPVPSRDVDCVWDFWDFRLQTYKLLRYVHFLWLYPPLWPGYRGTSSSLILDRLETYFITIGHQ